jgi:signal transduction histidine kinase
VRGGSGSGELQAADLLARLQVVTDAALAHLAPDQLLDELLTRIREVLSADTSAVLLLDESTNELVARAAKGLEEEVEQGVRIPVGRGFAGRIAAERRPVVIEDVDHSYVLNPILREKGVKSLLGAPLITGSRFLGVIHVGTLVHRTFRRSEIELLQVVAQRVALAVDRALAHDRVVQLTQMQREFVALAAHELRTPAATIYGLATTLHKRQGQLGPDVVDELILNLYQQGDRMRRLVEQLLDLSRLDSGRIAIEPQRVPLRRHIEEIVASITTTNRRGVEVAVPDNLDVMLDPATVERVLGNLVSNAIRYGRPPIVVTAEQSDHHVRIYVEDGGEGVAPEFVPYLFDRFRRSDDSVSKNIGTGLGLSIARSYARAHGGDVFYHGGGRGAKFELVVPAQPLTP